jgi:L-seryl-tRNA(Ser) seleniumtransferase
LEKGQRSKRSEHAEYLLTRLTGAESALVVNNNAAAVMLVLAALAKRKRVIISRTQLVEIGGGFRVPEVMEQSGAKLVSIGATNRVHLRDYQEALQQPAGLVMCAHHSNFRIVGFTSEPELKDIVDLTHQAGISLVHDLGSGALLDTARFGVAHEPTVQESLKAGADIVCFSGDKLLGGPQAGIIIGKKELLEKIKKHPLARAFRADKVCLAGLSATLLHFLKGEAEKEIPVWKMLSKPLLDLKKRVRSWIKELGAGELIDGFSMIGGGSLPGENQPTFLLALDVDQPNTFLMRLRQLPLPVIARVENDRVVFDPRTVAESEESVFLNELKSILGQD